MHKLGDGMVKLLLDHGARVNVTNNRGLTPLAYSVQNQTRFVIELLLRDYRADPNLVVATETNNMQDTPLHMACWRSCQVFLVRLLLEHGANAFTTNRLGWTPLKYAIQYQLLDIVKLLFEKKSCRPQCCHGK